MELTLTNVRKEYGEAVALGRESAGVDLTVEDGEFFTLVGPSGCGKTTTLRLVAGFEPTTTGQVAFDGREMAGVPPEDRNVGVVFQNYALFPHLSVAENVAYGLRFGDPPGGESREERVASLLELVDLPNTGGRDPTELSGGQQQRVALARALAPGPDLLLLDEPMSALDARLRERLRMQIREIQSTLGITTLYVTHDQEEALAVSDRVAVMNDGRIEQVGTPRGVYRRPATRFVAEFVGDNNVFEGRVVSVEREHSAGESPVETKGCSETGAGRPAAAGGPATDRERSADRRYTAQIEADGTTFAVTTTRELRVGDRVTFCVRPEQVTVVDDAGDGPGADIENVLETTVSETEFLGESTRSYLTWGDRELSVRSRDPLAGDVRVGFAMVDAHVVEVDDR
ncbi:ABC transporter ATP-binding protein [Halobellus ordinarius]|uniref:ABC transporter ATP-binding protein n=1 Tax=Halobellus ordinarius TaxID=3075120 RepID=UPI0028804967|nr:ABC transporter ATP-binding protein [Halobellus sp. ZY16]